MQRGYHSKRGVGGNEQDNKSDMWFQKKSSGNFSGSHRSCFCGVLSVICGCTTAFCEICPRWWLFPKVFLYLHYLLQYKNMGIQKKRLNICVFKPPLAFVFRDVIPLNSLILHWNYLSSWCPWALPQQICQICKESKAVFKARGEGVGYLFTAPPLILFL